MGNSIIEIWQPRFKDSTVLIAKYKVNKGKNRISFTKTKCYQGMVFELEGDDISSYPVETNGKIPCYAVPLDIVLDHKVV